MDGIDREEQACELREPEPGSLMTADAAGLVISMDCHPGIRRVPSDRGFRYTRDDGRPVSESELARIERLKVPPAWTDVWICADAHGHLQATGRDARGRKQYRYHERWRATRDETKYERMAEFGSALPRIREAVDRDLRRSALDRQRVLALVVAVLDRTLVRVGNSEYARDNESFGLTTLRDEHVDVGSQRVRLSFRGKSGKEFEVDVDDPRVARALRRTRDLPGQELFQYLDASGQTHAVGSGDVNEYLRDVSGASLTSKDFRTWGGSLTFALVLARSAAPASEAIVTQAVREAAAALGNTPAVCRKAYIHPGIISLYLSGGFEQAWREARRERRRPYLSDEERVFLGLVRRLNAADESAA